MKGAAVLEGKYSVGIDIGGTKCAVILGGGSLPESAVGFIIDRIEFPTVSRRGWRSVIDEIIETTKEILSRNGLTPEDALGIGVSCGGPLDSVKGIIKCPPNLPDWDDVPITSLLSKQFGIPAFLQNDANACAVAEWKFGAGRGYKNVVFLTFGTGMGAGLILDGKLYSGTNDMAGEVGHIRVEQDGPEGYGKRGSFEGFCSGGGIERLARTMYDEHIKCGGKTILSTDDLSAKAVAKSAENGDGLALEVYRCCARHLGMGLSIITDILNPQIIIIGSIYERSQALLETEMMKVLKQEALPLSLGACKIVPAMLGDSIGDFAALGVLFANIQEE